MGLPVKGPPPPFVEIRAHGAVVWTRAEARPWVEASLEAGLTLHRAAAGAAGGGEVLSGGRGPVYVVRSRAGAWAVRHAIRGGAVARLLADRYLRLGTPRPFREATLSQQARRSGIPTPRVIAAAVYPAGIWYRADLVTEFVPDARSVGELLFGPQRTRDGGLRMRLLEEAAGMPRRLAAAGLEHRDLNVDNLLLPGDPGSAGLVLLDLDRCRLRRPPLPDRGRGMADRLARSVRRGEERRGPALSEREHEVFRAVLRTLDGAENVSRSRRAEAPSSHPGDGGRASRPTEHGTGP